MKKLILGLIIVTGMVAVGFWYNTRTAGDLGTNYRFVTVERGDLESVVASTGSLGAVTTVQVGTQVSGIVDKIYVDFNDKVRKGQIVARIDTTLLVSAIRDAEANLQRIDAQLKQAEREFTRIKNLYDQQFVSEQEFNTAQYNVDVAVASIRSAEISIERARQNLSYATIYAPISGTVIERNVDPGQTVAASLSAPQLFLIANDLAQMQILASVDESDIGLIKEGQVARFNVQAYSDDVFEGVVRQVRLQSAMQENVVSYTVVVDVDNDDGRLLPGMTATVEFLVDKVDDVLNIANAGIRFQPTESMMAEFRAQMEAQMASMPDSVRQRFGDRGRDGGGGDASRGGGQGGFGGGPGGHGTGARPGSSDSAQLWYIDEDGNLAATRVRTGLSDGQSTEITGRNLTEGMQIIAGITQGDASSRSTNPFQQEGTGGRRRGGF